MRVLLIGERYREILELPLVNAGFEPFWLPDNPLLDSRLASHSDLSVFKDDRNIILAKHLAENEKLVKYLTNRGYLIIASKTEQNSVYPNDVNICARNVGKYLIHNIRHSDPAILDMRDWEYIDVRQGYAACTALAVDEHSIITADETVAAKAAKHGIDTLIIDKGHVELEGFDEGFIGGAAFTAADAVYFSGDLSCHSSGEIMEKFILSRGKRCISLRGGALIDIGGAICL